MIEIDNTDLVLVRSTIMQKRLHPFRDVAKGLFSLPYAPVIEPRLDIDLWRYRNLGEHDYVAKLCALPAVRLEACRDRFIVDAAAICGDRAMLRSEFRYENRSSSHYRMTQLTWERPTLFALGLFVPYHLLTAYNLTETAQDRLLVRNSAS